MLVVQHNDRWLKKERQRERERKEGRGGRKEGRGGRKEGRKEGTFSIYFANRFAEVQKHWDSASRIQN
jgi:hypothetical protein